MSAEIDNKLQSIRGAKITIVDDQQFTKTTTSWALPKQTMMSISEHVYNAIMAEK